MAKDNKLTPMMQHYVATKEANKEHIIFYRMGDFYEMFLEDAQEVAKLLNITLTARAGIPMAGVPYHAKNTYLKKLIQMGRSVAICEQVEDPKKAKGMVKREVVEIITPGVQFDYEHLAPDQNNYLLTVVAQKKGYDIAYFDMSTLDFQVTTIEHDIDLFQEIAKIAPAEILIDKRYQPSQPVVERLQKEFRVTINEFDDTILGYIELDPKWVKKPVIQVSFAYLYALKKLDPLHLPTIKNYEINQFMHLSETTLRNLEVFQTSIEHTSKGSLFHILNHTVTTMGSRKLRETITHPLKNLNQINKRLAGVTFMIHSQELREQLRALLKQAYDIERLLGRVLSKTLMPRDLLSLAATLKLLNEMIKLLQQYELPEILKELLYQYVPLNDLIDTIEFTIKPEPPANMKDGHYINKGVDEELDEILALSENGKQFLINLEIQEKNRSKISTLKVKYNRVFGYFFEVSKSYIKDVPDNFEAKQTLTNATRFVTPELKELEEKLLSSEEKRLALEQKIYQQLLEYIQQFYLDIKQNGSIIAAFDLLAAFAHLALEHEYHCPELTEGISEVTIQSGRHPVLEQNLDLEQFIPNNLLMTAQERFMIITGPNMAGKSTIMRQTALIALMAQIGSYVPAESYKGSVFDAIFTRVGASDNLSRGESTFMVEMKETADIIARATERSLIIMDELGRGTSTFDGISLAWAIAEHIHDQVKGLTLFATHYHELTRMSEKKSGVTNYSISIREVNRKLYFLRKLVAGAANRSYGIHVGELAGLPDKIIQRASQILDHLEKKEVLIKQSPKKTKAKPLPLFSEKDEDEVRQKLKKVDLYQTTPLAALNLLAELKNLL